MSRLKHPRAKQLPLASVLLCATALSFASLIPQAAAETRWYQVNVAVFERPDGEEEFWRRGLELRYPEQTPRIPMTREEYLAEHCLPRAPEPRQHPPLSPLETAIPAVPGQRAHERAVDTLWRLSGDAACLPLLAGEWSVVREEDERPVRRPIPFTLLEQGDRQVDQAATRLRRNGYRVLFKGSWFQPLERDQLATTVLVRGGERFGAHRELEGYIQLALRRYLHLDTDLWLTRFTPVEDTDEEREGRLASWPTLPPPPLRHQAEQAPSEAVDNGEEEPGEIDAARLGTAQRIATTVIEQQQPAHQGVRRDGTIVLERSGTETRQGETDEPVEATPALTDAYDGYRIERLVTLRQQRRMRSNQLHYLDHPQFGLLIKINPVELAEDTENDAEEE